MERTNNGEFEDYWNEFRQSESTTQNDDSKDISSTFEEGETEVDWLRDAGFGFEFLVQEELAGQDEDSILEKELATLTHHQAETVKKRFLTWKNTFRRKRNHDRLPHVRDVFGQLKHGKEVIHVENFSSSLFSNERSEDRLPEVEHSLAYYRAPNNNDLFAEIQNKHSKSQRKEKEFRRSSHKEYKLRSCNDSNSDIEILRYQICGTMKHHSNQQLRTNYSENDKSPAITLCSQVDATTPQTVDFRVKEKVFTEHQNSEELPVSTKTEKKKEVEQIHEKYGLTYPADLGKGDLIKIQRLALIELTTLFDSLGLTYTRKKPIKIKTKENMVFGVPLTTLLEYDCKMYTHCRVPLVFQKILFSLENQGLTEVGLLRVGSSRQKVEVLKKEIEAYFYTSPDIVDNILYSCSPHEVASLLKHFIREPSRTSSHQQIHERLSTNTACPRNC
ncbi:rho GTPase-activating protein 18-like isoform X1 [Tachypleus tridentatus]|uniref:rho GTPase-activating protein 18-like isoform X1 n=1 Tax=Tachypleus tridentatus TaxID=6853 RepID=UPI003FCFC683